jgi:putative transcriptional regulator
VTITHHPGEELLLSYALGSAGEPIALLVSTHLSACGDCRSIVDEMESAGGAMLANVAPAAMNDRALQSVLSRLDDKQPVAKSVSTAPGDVPGPLRFYIGDNFSKARWVPVAQTGSS